MKQMGDGHSIQLDSFEGIEIRTDLDAGFAVFSVTSLVTADLVCSLIEYYWPKQLASHCIWDFRNSDLSGLTLDGFEKIALTSARLLKYREANPRTAFLIDSTQEAILLKLYEAVSGDVQRAINYRTFTDDDAARAFASGEA